MGCLLFLGFGSVLSLGLIAILFFEVFKFPDSVLLPLAEFRVSFLDKDNGRNLNISIIFNVVELHKIDCIEIKT
jgi:hypothetical protein